MPANPLISFAVASIACTISPGPNAMLVIRNTAAFGARSIVPTLAGQLSARLMLALAVVTGLNALLLANPQMAGALKLAGAVYLIYIGIRAVAARERAPVAPQTQAAEHRKTGMRALAVEAALVCGLNPNTLAFFAAALPQVLNTRQSIAAQLPPILLIDETTLLVVMFTYSMLTDMVSSRLRQGKWRLRLKRTGGAVMLLFAAGALTSMA